MPGAIEDSHVKSSDYYNYYEWNKRQKPAPALMDCKGCKRAISLSTTSARRHLISKHHSEYVKLVEEKLRKANASIGIASYLAPSKDIFEDKLLKLASLSTMSCNLLVSPKFCDLINYISPKTSSYNYFSDSEDDDLIYTSVECYKRFYCLAHQVNIILESISMDITAIKVLLTLLKNIKRVPLANEKLKQLTLKRVKLPGPTRWGHTIMIMGNCLIDKVYHIQVASEFMFKSPSTAQWRIIEEYTKATSHIFKTLNIIQGDSISSKAYGLIQNMYYQLNSLSLNENSFAKLGLEECKKRLNKYTDIDDKDFDICVMVSCFFDPTVTYLLEKEDAQKVIEFCIQNYDTNAWQLSNVSNPSPEIDTFSSNEFSFFELKRLETQRGLVITDPISSQTNNILHLYYEDFKHYKKDNLPAIEFWNTTVKYIALKIIALQYINFPVSSVAIERAFSSAKFCTSNVRNRTKEKLLNDKLLVYLNKKHFY
uniref:Dimer_Tnp_hAT domain-containing protein n=1 Tax=Rhabditophanes sp. KR3021 TaxID=114890 RepID=A0AC35TPQ5_9BILA